MNRPLVASDVAAVAARLALVPLMQRYGRTEAKLAADLTAALHAGDRLVVEEDAGTARGLLWYLPAGTFAMGGYLKLIALFPGSTGKGIGKGLLAEFEAGVARAGKHAFLLVSDFNKDAQRFYEREGYSKVGVMPKLVLPDVDELVYWKRLR
jgi:GNAT superfamily N-acetyltransferase